MRAADVVGVVEPDDAARYKLMGLPVEEAGLRDVPRLTGIRELYLGLTGDRQMRGVFNPSHVQFANATTATLAELLLGSDDTRRLFGHEEVRNLFLWHALEECEHKAVAFDVYKAVGGSERRPSGDLGRLGGSEACRYHHGRQPPLGA